MFSGGRERVHWEGMVKNPEELYIFFLQFEFLLGWNLNDTGVLGNPGEH